jgi:catechol 2,3-dioxygenase-like lactoylglutathione lyase family enzyme
MSLKLDHIYLSVKDMDRAVSFWENLLETKVKHREENTWADFDIGSS